MTSEEPVGSAPSRDPEYTDWMSLAEKPYWIKYLRYEKAKELRLAECQVSAIKQLTDIMFEARAIFYAEANQKLDRNALRRLDYSTNLVKLMCLRGLLTDQQESYYLRNFTFCCNAKPSAYRAMRSRTVRHYLDVKDEYWEIIGPAIELAARSAGTPKEDAYWDKCDEVAFSCMSPTHRKNWGRLQQPSSPPADVAAFSAESVEADLDSLSSLLGTIVSAFDDFGLDERRPPTRYYPNPRTQRELIHGLIQVLRLGYAWIIHRTDGPFLDGDGRNESDSPVGQTRRMFVSYAEEFALHGILLPAQVDDVRSAIRIEDT